MNNNTSTPVFGDNFIGRKNELKEATYLLQQGNSIALFGLRRMGKSSILKQLNILFEKDKYHSIYIDTQILSTRESFLMSIFKELPNKDIFYTSLTNILPNPVLEKLKLSSTNSEMEISFKKDIIDYFDEISKALARAISNDKKILLLIDELPYFFENMIDDNEPESMNHIKQILTMLRFWRNNGVCMAICGSIQIEYFLESIQLSNKLLSGLNHINIGAFSKEESFELLDALSKSNNITISKEKKEKILELIGDCTPFFIQNYFAQYILNKPKTIKEMILMYDEKVFPNIDKEFLSQFNERFAEFTQEESIFVEQVFTLLDANSSMREKDMKDKIKNFNKKVFLKLLSQEFIINHKNKISFSFNIVQKWWKNK